MEDNSYEEHDEQDYSEDESCYVSNISTVHKDGSLKKYEEFMDEVANQSLREASTQDLVAELQNRFQDFICLGKRYLTAPSAGGDRDVNRKKTPKVEYRRAVKGDVHTLTGMAVDTMKQLEWHIEEDTTDIECGTHGAWELDKDKDK